MLRAPALSGVEGAQHDTAVEDVSHLFLLFSDVQWTPSGSIFLINKRCRPWNLLFCKIPNTSREIQPIPMGTGSQMAGMTDQNTTNLIPGGKFSIGLLDGLFAMRTLQPPDDKMATRHILKMIHKQQIDGGSTGGPQ